MTYVLDHLPFFMVSICVALLIFVIYRKFRGNQQPSRGRGSRLRPDPDTDPQEHARQTVRLIMKSWAGNEGGEGIKQSLVRSGLVDADGADVFMGIARLITESMEQHSDPQKLHDDLAAKGVPEPVIMGSMAALIEYLGEQEGQEDGGEDDEEAEEDGSASEPPSSEEAFARLRALRRVVGHGLVSPPKDVRDKLFQSWPEAERQKFDAEMKKFSEQGVAALKAEGLWERVSPKERAFLLSYGSKMDGQAQTNAVWRKEGVAMLAWALGLTPEWPAVDREVLPDDFKKLGQDLEQLKGPPKLRAREELAARRDLIELWHWRVRTRQLIEEKRPFAADANMKKAGFNCYDDIVRFSAREGHKKGDLPRIIDDDFVFGGKAFRALSADEYGLATSVIMERHYALNWLCGLAPGNRWDETPTDT
jgi:hypothetical protein